MYVAANPRLGCCFAGLGSFLDDLAGAITRQEGACSSPGSCINNNPGNLRAGPGMIGTDSRGIAIFPDFQTGYAALLNQEQLNVNRGLTLSEFFGGKSGVYPGYAPAADSNQPNVYTANVASWLGIPSDVPLSDLMSGSAPTPSDSAPIPAPSSPAFDLSSLIPGVTDSTVGGVPALAVAGLGLLGLGLLFAAS